MGYRDGTIEIELSGKDEEQLKKTRLNLVKRFGDRALKLVPEIGDGFYTDTWGNYSCYIIIADELHAEELKQLNWDECTCKWTQKEGEDFYCPVHKK